MMTKNFYNNAYMARAFIRGNPGFSGIMYVLNDVHYIKKGSYHRIEGPAIEWHNGAKAWYIDGEEMTEDEHKNWIRNNKLEKFLND